MSDTKAVAQNIIKDAAHRGSVVIPKDDAVAMARGYLEWLHIKDTLQAAINDDLIHYRGISVSDNVEGLVYDLKS